MLSNMTSIGVYENFLSKHLTPNWDKHPLASDALLEMVIVEPRCHKYLAPVLKNVSSLLPHAALTIIHSRENKTLVDEIVGNRSNIRRIASLPSNLTSPQYTRLLLSPSFWEQLECDKILIFQTDAGILQNTILDFLHVDYIGAPWVVNWAADASSKPVFVGNGGLSLRDRNAMIKVCKHHQASTFNGPEDIFFARHVETASIELALRFAMESVVPNFIPFGFHRPWDIVPPTILQSVFNSVTPPPSRILMMRVTDVWLTYKNGTKLQLNAKTKKILTRWILLGTNSSGFRVSAGARVPVPNVEEDVDLYFSTNNDTTHHIPCKFVEDVIVVATNAFVKTHVT